MYRVNDSLNQNVQEKDSNRETVSRTHDVELDIQVLEERIAPQGILSGGGPYGLNRSETMSGERAATDDSELDILVLEERIAPHGVIIKVTNRSETMSGERAATDDTELDILVLEERIAPGGVISHGGPVGF